MATTRAGQIQCRANWQDYAGDDESVITSWVVSNPYNNEVRFNEYALRDFDYYKTYSDDVGRNYYDIRFYLNKNGDASKANLLRSKGATDINILNDEIYCIKFKPYKNSIYTQHFSIVLHNSENNDYLAIQSFKIPPLTEEKEYEVYFCPESFGSINNYDEIIFEVNREDESAINVIMELHSFELIKLNNLMNDLIDEKTGEPIEELLALHFETLNRGECLFFVNYDSFWIGNDKVLNIDENLDIIVTKLAYIKYEPRDDKEYDTDDYITCLVNYKY